MISLELAKKLKKAGLKWEPKACDAYYWPSGVGDHPVLVMHNDFDMLKKEQKTKGIVWAPRLEQLLSEIERRGWEYQLHYNRHDGHPDLLKYDCGLHRQIDDLNAITCFFVGHSADEAAAKALLWILRRERDAE